MLSLGHGVAVGRDQSRNADAACRPARRDRSIKVEAQLARNIGSDRLATSPEGPGSVWVTDITERPTHEGRFSCCDVLDTYSRRVVRWPIGASPATAL